MAVYTDGVHLIADSVTELHEFAGKIGLKRCWFHGSRKKHPHYDLVRKGARYDAEQAGAIFVGKKKLVSIYQELKKRKHTMREFIMQNWLLIYLVGAIIVTILMGTLTVNNKNGKSNKDWKKPVLWPLMFGIYFIQQIFEMLFNIGRYFGEKLNKLESKND